MALATWIPSVQMDPPMLRGMAGACFVLIFWASQIVFPASPCLSVII